MTLKNRQNDCVFLTEGFVIKGSKEEQVLLNLYRGTRYELDHDQYKMLTLCDGRLRLSEILSQYDVTSQQVVLNFIDNLVTAGAINFTGNCKKGVTKIKKLVSAPRLQAVHLEATSGCNMKCAHCYQGKRYPLSDNLRLEEVFRIINEMANMQVEGVSISGGEPFFDSRTFDFIKLIEDLEMRVISIFTNGLLLNQATIERLLGFCSNPTFFVSLDSITPKGMIFRGFDKSKGGQALDKILENIKELIVHKNRVVVNTVMNRGNVADIRKMYNVMVGLGVHSWRIGFPKKTGFFKADNDFELPWETMMEASFKLLKHHLKSGNTKFHLQLEYLYRPELAGNFSAIYDDDFVCDYEGRRESCCVKPNGDVVSCAYCTDFPIGNVKNDSLNNIWHSSCMREVKEIRVKDVSGCDGCELKTYCATGCRINAYFLNGDFQNSKDDYACKAIRFFVDRVLPLLKEEGVM